MAFLIYIFFFLTTLALAAPTTSRLKSRSFQVDRVQRNGYVAHGPAALSKAYRKFNISSTTTATTASTNSGFQALNFKPINHRYRNKHNAAVGTNSTSAGQNGTVATTSVDGDVEFVSPVSIGGQTIMMDFDTGSSDLWVFSSELSAADQKSHTVFDTQKSSTFKKMQGATFKISYGDGSSASGNVGTDVVNIGGASVQTQAVELATQVSGSFLAETASNGLVGLAFSNLNTVSPTQQKTFFDNIASQLDEPVMTVSLKSDSSKGAYEFGTIDSTKYTGKIANISVDPTNGFWQFTSASFKVGDNGDTKQMTTTTVAIADTGTSLMLVSPEAAQGYYEQVEGSVNSEEVGGYMFPCNAQLPTFTVAVGKSTATIPSNVVSFAQVGTDMSGTEYCYGGIQSSEDSKFMIFGDVFLKTMFVIFDQRGPSLGLATSA
ncbi:uncharacterized protein TRUGW13939_05064 [Talaromyces rugulosus]|uniref:Peptidase A1 domain-containing protein n=1 Tax=Talaromyces rugulosus TaxID=121627 RepID=A0A7H8QV95_TALRU|nr:uncharacterized protein TRUGW13939_05064 [Talaromyces rugulosus]QKX57944.1 hypothetical protein TRUGW13939_05064 [Talaromyces rugulosus]